MVWCIEVGVMAPQTSTMDGGESNEDYPDLEIVIAPDDIVDALRNLHERPDRNGREVITIRPPFEGEQSAKHRFHEAGNYWPPEMDPKPLDLGPGQFVGERARRSTYPTWNEVRSDIREEPDVELTDENEREWYDNWADVWEEEVRADLKDEIDINEFGHGQTEMVPVRYEEDN